MEEHENKCPHSVMVAHLFYTEAAKVRFLVGALTEVQCKSQLAMNPSESMSIEGGFAPLLDELSGWSVAFPFRGTTNDANLQNTRLLPLSDMRRRLG